MRLHYLQHVPFEGPGAILDWALTRGITVSSTWLFERVDLPSMNEFDMLVVMGGPMGVSDEKRFPWLSLEIEFIKNAIDASKFVLGICLGAQLISHCLGGVVRKNKFKEVGWFPVSLTPIAWEHPIFSILPATFQALHWHGDTFSIPGRALHMASSEACHNQAFVYGDRVIGLQFHLETTEKGLEDIMKGSPGDMEAGDGDLYVQHPDIIREKSRNLLGEIRANLFKLMDAVKDARP